MCNIMISFAYTFTSFWSLGEAHACEERARNAMIDAARLAEELRAEQEQTAHAENTRRMADALIKDLQLKVKQS